MMTQEETMKVIAEGVAPEQICPMIDEIRWQTRDAKAQATP